LRIKHLKLVRSSASKFFLSQVLGVNSGAGFVNLGRRLFTQKLCFVISARNERKLSAASPIFTNPLKVFGKGFTQDVELHEDVAHGGALGNFPDFEFAVDDLAFEYFEEE
jgi:hypothetical protein